MSLGSTNPEAALQQAYPPEGRSKRSFETLMLVLEIRASSVRCALERSKNILNPCGREIFPLFECLLERLCSVLPAPDFQRPLGRIFLSIFNDDVIKFSS